jgi:hypothetical protein
MFLGARLCHIGTQRIVLAGNRTAPQEITFPHCSRLEIPNYKDVSAGQDSLFNGLRVTNLLPDK